MENRAHALAAGLFIIILSAVLAVTAVWLSGGTIVRERYLLVSEIPVTGLNPQAAVRYRGVSVGKVENMRLDPDNMHRIFIRIAVDRDVPLGKDVYAQLGYQGLTGLAFVQLNDEGKQTERLQTSEDNPARIYLRPSALDNIANSGQHLLSNTNELAGRLNSLLNEQNQKRFSNILENMEGTTGRFDSVIDQLQPGLKSLPELTTEARVAMKHAAQLVTDFNQTVVKINQQGGVIDSLSQTTGELTDTIPKLYDVADGITRTTRNVNRVLLRLEEQPRSLLFGRSPPPPGPGEEGFVPPQSIAK